MHKCVPHFQIFCKNTFKMRNDFQSAIKADLAFLIERWQRFGKVQALKPPYTMVGMQRSSSPGSSFSGGTASELCRSFGASRWSPRYSPSFS